MSESKKPDLVGIVIVAVIVLIIVGYYGVFTDNESLSMILPILLCLGALLVGFIYFVAKMSNNKKKGDKEDSLSTTIIMYLIIVGFIIYFFNGCTHFFDGYIDRL